MKLYRLSSTTQRISQESVDRVRQAAAEGVRRVEMLEGIEGDRQRSLRQELAEIDPNAIGEFNGGEQLLKEAREVAYQLSELGESFEDLVKSDVVPRKLCGVDDKA